jgi:hypothetical protein
VCPPFQGLEGDVELSVIEGAVEGSDYVFDFFRVIGDFQARFPELFQKRGLTNREDLCSRYVIGKMPGKHKGGIYHFIFWGQDPKTR